MRGLALAILLLTACDQVYGLDHVHAARDGSPGDASDDASVDAACAPSALTGVSAIEDTQLVDESNPNPANRSGGADTIDLGLSGTSRILLRFALSAEMQGALANDTVVDAALTLTIRTSGGLCGNGCTTGATSFQIYAANNYWNEGSPSAAYYGAAWHNRFQTNSLDGQPWQTDGADGSTDRSFLAAATYAVAAGASGTQTVTFPMTAALRADFNGRLSTNQLSLILVPTSGGTMFVFSREGSAANAATLTFRVCP